MNSMGIHVLVDICGLHANGTMLYRSILARRPAGVQVFFWVHITFFFLSLNMYFVMCKRDNSELLELGTVSSGRASFFLGGSLCCSVCCQWWGVVRAFRYERCVVCVCECLCVCMNETFQTCE